MGLLTRLTPLRAGDSVAFKESGIPAQVLRVEFQKAFVQFVAATKDGSSTGRVVQQWVEKSALRKI